jgi:hypothetical protein
MIAPPSHGDEKKERIAEAEKASTFSKRLAFFDNSDRTAGNTDKPLLFIDDFNIPYHRRLSSVKNGACSSDGAISNSAYMIGVYF